MKKIVDFIGSVFANHAADLNAKSKIEVNYWCPTGMIPIKISPEEEKVD